MAILPTRTSSDSNSSADVNELSGEALDKGGTSQLSALTEETTPVSGDWFLMEDAGTGALKKVDSDNLPGSGGGSKADFLADFPAGSWDYPSTDYAVLVKVTGTNGDINVNSFDDTAIVNEYVYSYFKLPPDMSGTGSDDVTFYIEGFAKTATASRYVAFDIEHSAKADAEDWDTAFSTVNADDLLTDSTQDNMDFFTKTATITTLGWSAGDTVRIRLKKQTPTSTELSGEYYVSNFRIRVPRG